MRTLLVLPLLVLLAALILPSRLHARRFTDAEKKLNAVNSHNLSVQKWKKLYSLKPAAEQAAKSVAAHTEENVSSGVTSKQVLKPSPPKTAQFQQQPQQQQQQSIAPVITKNPKEEKQKKERYFSFFTTLINNFLSRRLLYSFISRQGFVCP